MKMKKNTNVINTDLIFVLKGLIKDLQSTLSAAILDHKFYIKPTILRYGVDQR